MAIRAHQAAVQTASKAISRLDSLFRDLFDPTSGDFTQSSRFITEAVRRGLAETRSDNVEVALEYFADKVVRGFERVLPRAIQLGFDSAEQQIAGYGKSIPLRPKTAGFAAGAVYSVQAEAFGLRDRVMALLQAGAKAPAIQESLETSRVSTVAGYWLAEAMTYGIESTARRSRYGWQKQVIALIDPETTECCLRAHGQIRALEEDFSLEGERPFAQHLGWPPFHWNCRSSIVLYLREHEDGLTDQMVEEARRMLSIRGG